MSPLHNCFQGGLAEMCFRFKINEEIVDIYEENIKRLMKDFNRHMPKLLAPLTNLVQSRNNHVFVNSR